MFSKMIMKTEIKFEMQSYSPSVDSPMLIKLKKHGEIVRHIWLGIDEPDFRRGRFSKHGGFV